MFEEEEPGKPRDWKCTIGIIIFVCILNVCIFIVIRVLLDSENEFDEPLVQGKLRDDLTQFLGIFALSFCFGCYCCFCCGGECFTWPMQLCNKDSSLSMCWEDVMKKPYKNKASFRRKRGTNHVTFLPRTEIFEDNNSNNYTTPETNTHSHQNSDRPNRLDLPIKNTRHFSIDIPRLNYVDIPVQLITPIVAVTPSTTTASNIGDKGAENIGYSSTEDIFKEII